MRRECNKTQAPAKPSASLHSHRVIVLNWKLSTVWLSETETPVWAPRMEEKVSFDCVYRLQCAELKGIALIRPTDV